MMKSPLLLWVLRSEVQDYIRQMGWRVLCRVYEDFSLDEPFDHKKLKFYLYQIDGLFVVDHMQYEDKELSHVDGSSAGKDFQVWFDD